MKTRTLIMSVMVGLLVTFISGCALYRSEAQYDRGKWHGLAGSGEVARTKQDKLALEKLQAQPVMAGMMTSTGVVASASALAPGTTAAAGFKGIIANLSSYRRYTFRIHGPENKSFYLGPGERATDYLLPGRYVATIHYGGSQVGQPLFFAVGVQEKVFQGEKCHWYLVAEW